MGSDVMVKGEGSGATENARERWVFGYGSLMWRPGFKFVSSRPAVLQGWRRAFCVYSVLHRGTYRRPGLVLGLIEGGAVCGTAFKVAEADWAEAHAYLVEREHWTETYVPAEVEVKLVGGGRSVRALTFLSDTQHPQWAGDLNLEAQARLIAGARGLSGRNVEYLRSLVEHLIEHGAPDPVMEALLARVEALEGREAVAA